MAAGYGAPMWSLLGLWACAIPEDPSLAETGGRDAYARAWCGLYADPVCLRDQRETCDDEVWMSDRTSCANWLRYHLSQCEGADAMFDERADAVAACVEQMARHTCGEDAFCDDGVPVSSTDACAPVSSWLDGACPWGETP